MRENFYEDKPEMLYGMNTSDYQNSHIADYQRMEEMYKRPREGVLELIILVFKEFILDKISA